MAGTSSGSPTPSINKAGATQPRPTAKSSGRNPGQGTGAAQPVHGRDTPTIVKTGAKNNGGK